MGSLLTATPENGSLTSVTWAPGKEPGTSGKFVQGANTGTARLIFNNDTNNYLDIPVTINASANHVTPTDPGVDPDHPDDQHSDLFMSVTRKVYVDGVENAGLTQTIRYARDKYTDSEGNVISYGVWKIGKVESGAWVDTPSAAASFAQETAPAQAGKDTYVQYGSDTSTKTKTNIINAQNVPTTSDAQGYVTPQDGTPVYVTYQSSTPATEGQVTITYVEKDNPSNILGTASVSGSTGVSVNVKATIEGNVPAHWKIDPNFTVPESEMIPGSVTVPLVHATKTVNPCDHGVDPNNPLYQGMFKTVTRTINVQNPDGTTDRTLQQVHFNRSETIDEVTNEVISYGDWSLADGSARDWGEFDVPQLSGYTSYVDGNAAENVAEENVTPETSDVTVNVTYQSNTPTPVEDTKVTYQFHDDTDNKNVGAPVVVTGKPGTNQSTGLKVPDGYKLAEGQTFPATVTMPAETGDTIIIHLVHATKTVNPGDHGVDPNNPLYQGMFKTVTRTINVQNPDGTTDRTLQQVHFNRSETIDEVTSKVISYGDWSLADGSARDWGEFDVPQLNGYTSYVDGNAAKQVNEESVTADTADVTVEVTYKTAGTPSNPGDHNNPTVPGDHNNPTVPGDHNTPTTPGQNGQGKQTKTNTSNSKNKKGQTKAKKALPQTGNTKNTAALAGLGLLGLTSLLGFGKRKQD